MNIHQLKVFIEMCGGSTLAETAEKMGLKQPTASFHLRKLEEELGVELFRKQSRSLYPGEAAAELLPFARRIVHLTEAAQEAMSSYKSRQGGRLRLGASYTPATYVLPSYIADFQSKHPGVSLQLTVKQAEGVLAMLREYIVDAGIVSLGATESEGLVVVPLLPDELQLLMSPEHPLAASGEPTIERLAKETFLLHETGSTSRTLSDEWAESNGLSWSHVLELGAIETIKEAIKCNMGIGILPGRSVRREVEAGELAMKKLPGYVNRRYICLAYRDEDQLSGAVRSFLSYIGQALAQHGKL
ncbi:LysR substrate-binding domain-containing protein [Paenibacillus sp. PL2-23]|uniref:LysR family transcriptional regulator n=1 Tax=Paenibacillus sp. PL2-23 TaxID=2100729 RepID=UPI0030F700C4